MYDVSESLYSLSLLQFTKKVKTVFVLNGAFCYIDDGASKAPSAPVVASPSPPTTVAIPATVVSSGFSSVSSAAVPSSATALTDDNIVVHFTFYQKFETTLLSDIKGEVYKKDGKYYLHIANTTKVLDVLGHDDVLIRLTDEGIMTVEVLRGILGKVRAFYFLEALDKLHDVLLVPSEKAEKDEVLTNVKKYINYALDAGFKLALCAETVNSKEEANILSLRLRKADGTKSEKEVLTIHLYPRKYEPSIVLKTMFEDDTDPFKGVFIFLKSKSTTPYRIEKIISPTEADYFVNGILQIQHDLQDYKFVNKTA